MHGRRYILDNVLSSDVYKDLRAKGQDQDQDFSSRTKTKINITGLESTYSCY